MTMHISEAAAYALLGERVRRAIWHPELWLASNYVALHLAVGGTADRPYTLTLEDLTARDWELDPSSPQAVLARNVALYKKLRDP